MQSNAYIIGFAAAVCAVCGVVVSGSAVSLKERQEINAKLDVQKKVLTVAGLMAEGESLERAEIEKRFGERIKQRVVSLDSGEYVELSDEELAAFANEAAFSAPETSYAVDAAKHPAAKKAQLTRMPKRMKVYEVMADGAVDKIILPIRGKGLWSTMKGFIALKSDAKTIAGITYYSHGETPGLGGEVDNPGWKALWPGRKAYGEGGDVAIKVIKGKAGSVDKAPHEIDGLSGATLTSNGVTNMLQLWLGAEGFKPYLKRFGGDKQQAAAAAAAQAG